MAAMMMICTISQIRPRQARRHRESVRVFPSASLHCAESYARDMLVLLGHLHNSVSARSQRPGFSKQHYMPLPRLIRRNTSFGNGVCTQQLCRFRTYCTEKDRQSWSKSQASLPSAWLLHSFKLKEPTQRYAFWN